MPPVPPLLLSLLHEHLSCYPSMRVAMWFQPIAISFIVESIEPPAKLTRAADSGFYSLNYYFFYYKRQREVQEYLSDLRLHHYSNIIF